MDLSSALCDLQLLLQAQLPLGTGQALLCAAVAAALVISGLLWSCARQSVYIVDFSVFNPDPR